MPILISKLSREQQLEQVKEELTRFECVDETSKRGRSRMSSGTGNIFEFVVFEFDIDLKLYLSWNRIGFELEIEIMF